MTQKLTLTLALLLTTGLLLALMTGAQDEPLFHVIPNNNLNLRACGSTDCDRVGQVPAGTELSVYAVEGDWYQVVFEGELVWIAGWLTTRATVTPTPADTPSPTIVVQAILRTGVYYSDRNTDCIVSSSVAPAEDIPTAVLLGGTSRQEVEVEIWRPVLDTEPLSFLGHFEDHTEGEDAEYFTVLYFDVSTLWPDGLYRFRISLGNKSSTLLWRKDGANPFTLAVTCGPGDEFVPSATPTPTATVTPSLTPSPTVTPSPTQVPDTVLRTEEVYLDRKTDCSVLVTRHTGEHPIAVVLVGSKRDDVEVDVFRPEKYVVPISEYERNEWTFSDTGQPYHFISFDPLVDLSTGLYRFQVALDGETSLIDWNMEESASHLIYFFCPYVSSFEATTIARATAVMERNRRRINATLAARATATPVPTATPSPTLTRTPTSTPAPPFHADQVLSPVGVYHDEISGCSIDLRPGGAYRDMEITIGGDRNRDVELTIYSPDQESPLVPTAPERWISSGSEGNRPYIPYRYGSAQVKSVGWYRLAMELDGHTIQLAWYMGEGGGQDLIVRCDSANAPGPRVSVSAEVKTDAQYLDPATECNVLVSSLSASTRLENDVRVIRQGEERDTVSVFLWLPTARLPLTVDNVLLGTGETGEPMIWQNYPVGTVWRRGRYHIRVARHGESTTLLWRMMRDGQYRVIVNCDRQSSGPAPSM